MSISEKILYTIGPVAMEKLCREFGGQNIYIPKETPDPERDQKILSQFSEAVKITTTMNAYQQCADSSGLSIRRIQEIVARS